jgi:anionic cell wall polymer biosynthesis LytR-Cps2A-Psr (LCP) family protein
VQALNFVRERHGLPGGDLDRIVRQQVFLGALAKQILSAGTLASPSRLDGLISAVQSAVTISSGWDIFTFAQEMQGLSSGAVQFLTIPTGGGITVGGADMLEVSQSKVAQFVRELMTDGVTPAGATSSADTPGATTPTDTAANPATPNTGSGAIGSTDPTDTNGSATTDTTADGSQVITADGTPCVN